VELPFAAMGRVTAPLLAVPLWAALMLAAVMLAALAPTTISAQTAPQSQEDQRPIGSRLGAIGGTVVETDGTPIPHVTVRLVGPAPRRTERRVQADAEGRFEFTELRHGDYRLAVELPGLQAPEEVSVVILPGERLETEVRLSLFAYSVEVSVVARSAATPQLIDTDSTAERRELTNRELTRLPLPVEQVLDALPVFPGVVRGPNGLISIGGTLPADSVYLFNNADLMDPFTGMYRLRLPLEAVETMSLESGVSSAAYGDRLGGVVNVTTATAGTNWDTEIVSPFPRPWLKGGEYRGIRRFTPRIRISGSLSPELSMSQSFGFRFEREQVFDVPDERGDHTIVQQWQSLTQFDWKPGGKNDFRFTLLGSPDGFSRAGLSGLTPVEATSDINHGTIAIVTNHQHRFDERSFFDTTLQFNRQSARVQPQTLPTGPGFDMFPDHNDGNAFNSQSRRSLHWQLKTVYNRILGPEAGRHLLQVGFEVHQMNLEGTYSNDRISIYDNDGRLRRQIESISSSPDEVQQQRGNKWEAAVFVQDRWRPNDRFWLDAGLRVSHDSAVGSVRFAPRLGAAWDLTGDGRTLLKGAVGVVHRRVYLAEEFWDSFPTRVETTWDEDGNGERLFLPSRRQEDLDSPRALIWTLSATRRLGARVTAHVAYTQRDTRNQLVFDRVEHDPIAVTPGVTNLPFIVPDDAGIFLANVGRTATKQVEITANIRVGQQDQLFISYVTSSALGDLNDFSLVASDMPAPVLRDNTRAALRHDTPNRVVIWGTFHLPWELIVSPSIEWRSGFPWSSLDVYRDYADGGNERRFPDYFAPDLQVTKGFRLAGIPLRAGVLVTNFIFRANPRDVIATVDSPRFGEFLNKVPSRVYFRFAATF